MYTENAKYAEVREYGCQESAQYNIIVSLLEE